MEWVLISLHPYEYGLAVNTVREVLPAVSLTPVPEEAAWSLGILNLRGALLRVIDLRARVGLPIHPLDPESHLVVVQLRERCLVLLVDRVEGVHPLDGVTEQDGSAHEGKLISGAARHGNKTVLLINPEAL